LVSTSLAIKISKKKLPIMSRESKIQNFDPNGVGLRNNHFIGLPFEEEDAQVILIPVPWDLTVSFKNGTSSGPQNILEASYQLDLYDDYVKDAWKMGIYLKEVDKQLLSLNNQWRPAAENFIAALESEEDISEELSLEMSNINQACKEMLDKVEAQCNTVLDSSRLFGLIGGDHSIALAGINACAKKYDSFGILQIDAHMDLRKAYEGFTYSHASIFYNALQNESVSQLIQVGIRDYCQEEAEFIATHKKRVKLFSDNKIQEALLEGQSFKDICASIIEALPNKVYVSFDIDGLKPTYCPNTGTPVPGGLSFNQAKYLLKQIVESNRKIIGFDLCEVAGLGNPYDGNVGARITYLLSNYMGKSQGLT
jgi:agmatinase